MNVSEKYPANSIDIYDVSYFSGNGNFNLRFIAEQNLIVDIYKCGYMESLSVDL